MRLRCYFISLLSLSLIACANYSADSGLLALLASGSSGSAFWSNTNFLYRQKIVFGQSHDQLSTHYTAIFTMDTQTSSGYVASSSGDDVRIYYQLSDGSSTELDRLGWNWNSASTQIDFRMAADLAANQNEPDNAAYYIYYGNANASAPPALETNVYYFADFFNRTDSSTVNGGWTEWLNAPADPAIVSGRLSIPGNNNDIDAGVKQSFNRGRLTQNFILEWDWYLAGNTEANWVYFVNIGDSTSMLDTDFKTGVGPGIYFGEGALPPTFAPNNNYNVDYDIDASAGQIENGIITDGTALTAISFKISVMPANNTYAYYRAGNLINAAVPFTNAGATLDQIRLGTGDYINTATAMGYDNVRLYLKAMDDPEISLETVEIVNQ